MSAPNHVIVGDPRALEQPINYRFSPERGWQTIRTFRGPKDAIIKTGTDLAKLGYEVDINGAYANWTCVCTVPLAADGSSEAPINNWEVISNRINTDISLFSGFAGLTIDDINEVQKAFASHTPPTTPYTGLKALYFNILSMKVTDYPIYQQVIRHTQVVSNGYAVQTAFANVNSILKTSSLGAPSSFQVGLGTDGESPRAPLTNGTNIYKWYFGWLKHPPQLQLSAFNKISIIQDFEYGEYLSFIYGTPI